MMIVLNGPQLLKIHKSLVVQVESKGRAIYCKETLTRPMNDNLIIELPFVTWLDPFRYKTYCENCFKHIKIPIECEKCKTINYCSKECLKSSISHRTECSYLSILAKFGLFHMAVRILLKEFISLENKNESLDNKSLDKNDLSNDLSNNHQNDLNSLINLSPNLSIKSSFESSNTSLQILDSFYSLASQIACNTFSVLICFSVASVFTSKFLHLIYEFDLPNSEVQISVKLFQIALILKQNTMQTYDELNNQPIGHALYLTSSLLNHACKPNCARYFNGNQVFIRNLIVIPSNNELTISYGLNSDFDNYKDRREQLRERFGFECLCKDCCYEENVDSGQFQNEKN